MKQVLLSILSIFLTFSVSAMQEQKEQEEISSSIINKINKYRSACLEKHMPKALSNLVQEYNPIEDEWYTEKQLSLDFRPYRLHSLVDNKLAVTDNDKQMKIVDLNSGAVIEKMEKSHNIYETLHPMVQISKDEFAQGSYNSKIHILDKTTGNIKKTLKGHKYKVHSLCLLPGNRLASGSGDCNIKIWDLTTHKCIKTLEAHDRIINTLCLLPGNKLASGSDDNTIKIWNLDTYICEKTLNSIERVNHICILPGNKLVSASAFEIKIWDLNNDSFKVLLQIPNNQFIFLHFSITFLCSLENNKLALSLINNQVIILSNSAFFSNFLDEEFIKFMHEKESFLEKVPAEKEVSGCVSPNCVIS